MKDIERERNEKRKNKGIIQEILNVEIYIENKKKREKNNKI